MSETSSNSSSIPPLPPRRRPALSSEVEPDFLEDRGAESILSDELDPETLAEIEMALKEATGNEVVVDISTLDIKARVSAPILENYIDPHTVPIDYLLDQSRKTEASDENQE